MSGKIDVKRQNRSKRQRLTSVKWNIILEAKAKSLRSKVFSVLKGVKPPLYINKIGMNFSILKILIFRAIITSVQVLGGFKMLSDTKKYEEVAKELFFTGDGKLTPFGGVMLIFACLCACGILVSNKFRKVPGNEN